MSGKVEISTEDLETITALYRAELNIILDTERAIHEAEAEGERRFKANMKRRDAIEKRYLNGMTRFEWTEKFGMDPFTGESMDEMMNKLKDKLYTSMPGLKEKVEEITAQMAKASKADQN